MDRKDEGVEPADIEPGPAAPSLGGYAVERTGHVESRTRKKVTFDLDLQVRTIPKRIPIYERRPAVGTAHDRPQHPLAFAPRPVDIKGKDRYLLGATTTKQIIDLFSLSSEFPLYPMSPNPGTKKIWPQRGSAQAVAANAYNPYYTFANFRTSKSSRAAMNLRQITAALGEPSDSSVYKECESSKKVQASLPTFPSQASRHGARSADTIMNELGVSQSWRVARGNAIAAFSPSRLRINYQQQSTGAQFPKSNLSPTPPRGSVHGAHSEVAPSSPESWDRPRLPSVASQQISLNSRPPSPRKRTGTSDTAYNRGQGGSPMDSSPFEGGANEMRLTMRDRPPSRCSTIETYVISDITGVKPNPNAIGAGPNNDPRSAGTSSGHRRMNVGTTSRPLAWEAGIAIPPPEPVMSVSAIQTSPSAQNGRNLVQWQVTSRPPNLST